MPIKLSLLLIALGGCARLGFSSGPLQEGGGPRDSTVVTDGRDARDEERPRADRPGADRGSDAGACRWSPFGPSTVVAELNSTSDEWDPSISPDGLSIYFVSWRAGGLGQGDVWLATRKQPTDPFSAPVFQAALSSDLWEAAPFISRDGLSLFLCSSRVGGLGSADLWVSTRSAPGVAFGVPQHLAFLSSSSYDCGPVLSLDGNTLYFDSARPGGAGSNDIFIATRANPDSPFGTASPAAALNSPANDFMGTMTDDGLELFLASSRAGGKGKLDLWVARRTSTDAPWAFTNAAELNTPNDDLSPTLTTDRRTIYYVRDADTSGQSLTRSAIWTATRTCN